MGFLCRSLLLFGILISLSIGSNGATLTIRNNANPHSQYITKSKISLTNLSIIKRLNSLSSNPTLAPSPKPYETISNNAFNPKPFNAMRDDGYVPHSWNEDHNYGLDGDVLSQEQHENVYFTNDQQWAFQKNSPNAAMWIAIIFVCLCGVFIMCACLCMMK